MVFRGQPSRACELCRKKRIRCDRSKDGCGNCRRSGAECSGYRDELDLLFVHETARVVRKHGKTPQPWEIQSDQKEGLRESQTLPLPTIGELAARFGCPSTDDFALSYCYWLHVIPPDETANTSTIVNDAKVLSCMRALGMASLSTTSPSLEIISAARRYYVESIHLTNAALASPESVGQDSTLLAVMALALFEAITGSDERSTRAWSEHVHGTAALLALRGARQMSTTEGRLLYLQASRGILINCLTRSIPVPGCFESLVGKLLTVVEDPHSLIWRNHSAKIRLVQLKSEMVNNRIRDPRVILGRAVELDRDFEQMINHPDLAMQTDGDRLHETDINRPDLINSVRYQNSLAAQLRSAIAAGRILCQLIILATLEQHPTLASVTTVQSQIRASHGAIEDLQHDMLASVPYQLCLDGTRPHETESTFRENPIVSLGTTYPAVPMDYFEVANLAPVDLPVLRSLRGNSSFWQLAAVGISSPPGSAVRIATCDGLRRFGNAVGMSQASAIVDYLENNRMRVDKEKPWTSVLANVRA